MTEKKYRILEVCVDLDGGGIDRYLYNYCTRISDIQFDFAAVENKDGMLEKPLRNHGCNIYHVPRITKGVIANLKALKNIMSAHKYDAVHVHLGHFSCLALLCALVCGVKVRVVHAHIAFVPETMAQRMVRRILTPITKMLATDLAACGVDAAKWVWGNTTYNKGQVIVHNNAIKTDIYKFNNAERIRVREEFGLANNQILVGHVGRISDQKNQLRLVNIFKAILNKKPNSVLIIVGFFDESYGLREEIKRLGIQNNVRLLGVRDDIPSILNAMDVFVFPSKYEGLPFTLIETQCNGLPCVSADTVSSLVKVSHAVEFLSLADSDEKWAAKAIELSKAPHDAYCQQDIIKAGYDLDTEAQKLHNYYIERIKRC